MRDSDQHPFKGPFHFNGKDVFFDEKRNEFWDPSERVYLDHEVGLHLIDLYFGHQKAPLGFSIKVTRISTIFLLSTLVFITIGFIFFMFIYLA